jgi:hypothetical protein
MEVRSAYASGGQIDLDFARTRSARRLRIFDAQIEGSVNHY